MPPPFDQAAAVEAIGPQAPADDQRARMRTLPVMFTDMSGSTEFAEERGGIDLVGRAVNVAARVEAGGGKETDQILISEAVLAQLSQQPGEFVTVPAGMAEAKGVGPLTLHRLLWKESEIAAEPPPVAL